MRVLHTASGDPEAVSAVVMMTTEETVTGVSSKDDVVYQTVYACQDEILKISCLTGYSIKIVRANYGRFSIAICNDGGRSDFSVNCLSPGSLVTLQSRYVQDNFSKETCCIKLCSLGATGIRLAKHLPTPLIFLALQGIPALPLGNI